MTVEPTSWLDGVHIASGQLNSLASVHAFGRNVDVDGAEDIWAGGGDFTAPTTARLHNIVSGSANDAAAGTGARTVRIYGLNSNYALATEDITLNGTTDVPTVGTYTFIYKMIVLTAGSGGTNAGAITATAATDSTVSAHMVASTAESNMAIYQVPLGHTAYVYAWRASVLNTTADSTTDIGLFVKPFGGAANLKEVRVLGNAGSSMFDTRFELPLKVTEKSTVKVRATATGDANADVQASFSLVLVKSSRP